MASSSVGSARGCDGWRDRRAFKIVSLGPAIAITRVSRGPGEMPIDRLLIGCLLVLGGRPLDGDGRRALGNARRRGNFSATGVRHFLAATGAKAPHPTGRRPPSVEAAPVALLGPTPGLRSPLACALGRAIDLPPIAPPAEVDDAPA